MKGIESMKETKRAESIKSDSFKLDVHTYSYRGFWAFTLAEMMVVLLILSIVLAAMAPVMTTRMKRDNDVVGVWNWARNKMDGYFGLDDNQTAMIGQNALVEGDNPDLPSRLVIKASATRPNHILFKNDNGVLGRLVFQNNSLVLGTGSVNGTNNIAIGVKSLFNNTSGSYNSAVGYKALYSNTTGSNNTANGYSAMSENTTGIHNTAVGYMALYSNTTGHHNTAIGVSSLIYSDKASDNTAIGYRALRSKKALESSDGEIIGRNTALGSESLYSNTTGAYNTASGYHALYKNETGNNNIATGSDALYSNTTGSYNTASGISALYNNTTGSSNTASGYKALYKNTGSNNTASGYQALYSNETGSNNTGSNNTASGYQALYYNETGFHNTASGSNALYSNKEGHYNVATGYQALYSNETGSSNTASGRYALYFNKKGSYNTAIGSGACINVKGSYKTCIGANSGPASDHDWAKSTDSTERIFIGSQSKFNDAPAVLEVHNSDMSRDVAKDNIKVKDTAVVINGNLIVKGGIFAPVNVLGSNNYYATGKGFVGLINGNVDGDSHWRLSGGQLPVSEGSMPKYYENYGAFKGVNGTSDVAGYISDRRLKYVGKEFTSGLDKIRQLKVFNYTFKKDEKKTPHVGVIAQDLQKIFPNAVKKGADGFLTIRMEDMFYALVNAVKELDAKVTAMAMDFAKQKEQLFSAQKDINTLKKENKELKQALNKANNDNKKLEARLNALEAKIK